MRKNEEKPSFQNPLTCADIGIKIHPHAVTTNSTFCPCRKPILYIAFKFNMLTLTLILTENLLIQTKGAYYDTAVIETDLCNRHLCL